MAREEKKRNGEKKRCRIFGSFYSNYCSNEILILMINVVRACFEPNTQNHTSPNSNAMDLTNSALFDRG